MSKGFFMSIDGLFAIAVVLVTMGAFTTYYHAGDDYSRATEINDYNMNDTANIAFYLDKEASDFGLTGTIDPTWDYGSCSHRSIIEFNNDGSPTSPEKRTFCNGDKW